MRICRLPFRRTQTRTIFRGPVCVVAAVTTSPTSFPYHANLGFPAFRILGLFQSRDFLFCGGESPIRRSPRELFSEQARERSLVIVRSGIKPRLFRVHDLLSC